MANKKRLAVTLSALALTAVLAIGGTLAYLSAITETKKNTFTSGGGIDGEIIETDWSENHSQGWNDYKPGESTGKSPQVKLTKGSEPAYVAMKLTFKDHKGDIMDYERFKAYVSHDGINTGWEKIATNKLGEELYGYSTAINAKDADAATDPIFDKVTVNAGIEIMGSSSTTKYYHRVITKEDGKVVKDEMTEVTGPTVSTESYFMLVGNEYIAVGKDTLPKFSIDAQGYAIQTATFANAAAAKAELINLANKGVEAGSDAFFTAVVAP